MADAEQEGAAVKLAGAASLLLGIARGRGDGGPVMDALFEDTADGLAIVDGEGNVLRASIRMTELAGMGSGSKLWSSLPGQASALRAPLRSAQPAQMVLILPAGRTRRVLRLSLLPLTEGVALLRAADCTHEHELEEKLGQAHRLQAVGELAGGIAHDFNNLLTAIIGAADDLHAHAVAVGEDCGDIDLIRHSAERGAGLVRQLLAFSRQQMLQPRVIELNERVRAAASLLRRLLATSVTLDLVLEEPGRQVCIDPTQLDQVLINLAVNASHAMPGGGRLTIATGHALRLRTEAFGGEAIPPGRYATLSVTDTGQGIPADILPRIFEPFFTTKSRTGGTGLGLSTVHGIVRQSGGYMAVQTAPGEGTRFDILLPRHEANAAESAPQAPMLRKTISRTVLLVDDEAPVRALAERVLTRAGWQVVTAIGGEDALEMVATGDLGPALACVISDVVMPGMDGPALVRALRLAQPGLPAILMSGYADAGLRQALQADDIRFLGKPFAMPELLEALAGLLGLVKAA